MTDEERTQELTDLARRVVLAEDPGVSPHAVMVEIWRHFETDRMSAAVSGRRFQILDHPRAVDALEAALLVMLGERPSVNEWAANLAMDSVVAGEAEYGRPGPTWAEVLAAKWENTADTMAPLDSAAREWVRNCVADLRNAARHVGQWERESRASRKGSTIVIHKSLCDELLARVGKLEAQREGITSALLAEERWNADMLSKSEQRIRELQSQLDCVREWHARYGLAQEGGDELLGILDDRDDEDVPWGG